MRACFYKIWRCFPPILLRILGACVTVSTTVVLMIERGGMAPKSIFILDTNVLVHDPAALFAFEKAAIGIPITVLEELDQFKGESSQRGRNTRETIRFLDLLRERGSLAKGVELDNGGTLRVLFEPSKSITNNILNLSDPDNQILMTALALKEQGYAVKFISKDINMRVKADVLGLDPHDYQKDVVDETQFYKGFIKLQVPSVQLKKDIPDDLEQLQKEHPLTLNEFVIVESRNNPHNSRVFRYLGPSRFKEVVLPHFRWPLEARNPQQLMAIDLLLDNSVELVTLAGPAGTGKTFLALACALHELLVEQSYEKVLVTRPVIPLGPDIGYLPGDIHEKLHSWMQPIYDNMDFIVHMANAARQQPGSEMFEESAPQHEGPVHPEHFERNGHHEKNEKGGRRRQRRHKHHGNGHGGLPTLDELIRRGKISLEAITYMRGRSIPYQFIFIDEVQNLTPHEVKTLISRVGEGSKIILAGDPYQIDSPYLDFSSNGLIVAAEKFKGQELFGAVFLETSERSKLSQLAGQLM